MKFKVGDYIVYKKEVCQIKDIKKGDLDNLYYILKPIDDDSLKIEIPVGNAFLREPIKKEKINDIIAKIPSISIIECNEKLIEVEYKNLLYNGDYEDLIKIIKTTYLRNKRRIDNKKKIGDKDDYYFKKAEKYLYNEFSIALGKSFDETKEYIIEQVSLLE